MKSSIIITKKHWMTTWQLRCPMAPRIIDYSNCYGCGFFPVVISLTQTSFEIRLTLLPVSSNATIDCCANWITFSGITFFLLVCLPTTFDSIRERTFIVTWYARGASSFSCVLCGEKNTSVFFFLASFFGFCCFVSRCVVGNTLDSIP